MDKSHPGASVESEPSEGTTSSDEDAEADMETSGPEEPSPASARKLGNCSSSDEEPYLQENDGFRFVDLSVLAEVFKTLWCPQCKVGHVIMKEDIDAKMGLASRLTLQCSAINCSYCHTFFTSSRVENGQAFEVNRRAVLAISRETWFEIH